MDGLAGRLLAVVTALMPPARRGWGQAMLAELGHVRSRSDRAWLVLGAVRVALLPPPGLGLGGYGRAAGRACVVALVACVPLCAGLFLFNVVIPSAQDSTLGDLSMDAYLILALMTAGAAARRVCAKPAVPVIAGIAAGLVIAAFGMGTFAVIDNAFLFVVSHRQASIAGLHASGMTSMRAYLNHGLAATAPGVAIFLAFTGALLGALGAIADGRITMRADGLVMIGGPARRGPRRG